MLLKNTIVWLIVFIAFFWKLNEQVRPEFRKQVGDWFWDSPSSPSTPRLSTAVTALFVAAYGASHMDRACVWRSFVASTMFLILLFFVYLPIHSETFFHQIDVPIRSIGAYGFVLLVTFAYCYLSLLKTRFLLHHLSFWLDGFWRRYVYLIMEFSLTSLTVLILPAIARMFVCFFSNACSIWSDLTTFTLASYRLDEPYGLIVYSTLLATMLPYTVIALPAARVFLRRLRTPLSKLDTIIEIRERPFRSFGIVSGTVVSLGYLFLKILGL